MCWIEALTCFYGECDKIMYFLEYILQKEGWTLGFLCTSLHEFTELRLMQHPFVLQFISLDDCCRMKSTLITLPQNLLKAWLYYIETQLCRRIRFSELSKIRAENVLVLQYHLRSRTMRNKYPNCKIQYFVSLLWHAVYSISKVKKKKVKMKKTLRVPNQKSIICILTLSEKKWLSLSSLNTQKWVKKNELSFVKLRFVLHSNENYFSGF